MPLLMIRQDITKVHTDAIVNPANPDLQQGSGTSRGIYLAAGEKQLTEACRQIGHCDLGAAVITPGFDLPAKYVIHAVGPVWVDGLSGELQALHQTYLAVLKLARQYELESIAFPLLSAGNYGFPKKEALKVATTAIQEFLLENDMVVYLVLYDKESLNISQRLSMDIAEYIDDHYVEMKQETFPKNIKPDGREQEHSNRFWDRFRNRPNKKVQSTAPPMDLECVAGEQMAEPTATAEVQERGSATPTESQKRMSAAATDLQKMMAAAPKESQETLADMQEERCMTGEINLDDLMCQREETFSQMLLRLIDERGMTDAQTYKKANIDRKLFSKIRSNPQYMPSKKTVFCFAIALHLSKGETDLLLGKAGYAFSDCIKFDVVISYFIEHQNYDIFEMNEVLFQYDLPLLGGV